MRQVRRDTTFVGISELRTQADAILKAAAREKVVLEKRHKPVAVLVPIERYDRTEETLDLLEDYLLGLLARERLERSGNKHYISLSDLEQRIRQQKV